MILVKLYGGLGNQMFQYAAGRSLAIKLNQDLFYDDEYFTSPQKFGSAWPFALDQFKTKISLYHGNTPIWLRGLIHRIYKKANGKGFRFKSRYFEKLPHYNSEFNHIASACFIDGYFQSFRYFEMIRKELIEEFRPKSVDSINAKMASQMQNEDSISLHVRRGDYVSNPSATQVHGICSLDYYNRAVEFFESKFPNPVFYVFSDDLAWAQENIRTKSKKILVDQNQEKNFLDIFLMSQCRHNIIANSSFSWWGAWLNDHNNKVVIAPAQWFVNSSMANKDLCPKEWLRF